MTWELHEMDCRLAMGMLMDADSVDSVVCDPPYGLSKEPDMAEVLTHWLAGDDYVHGGNGFMGRSWDSFVPGPSVWREAYRVLKPGGHLVAFFGTRTYDLGVLALRLAGFEIRDQLAWVFGSGFPKSHDVSKGIDKALGAERPVQSTEKVRDIRNGNGRKHGEGINAADRDGPVYMQRDITGPATPEAAQWQGWGTALKPAYEPIVLARKPLVGTVARNVLSHGAGALNIDGCRVETDEERRRPSSGGDNGLTGSSTFKIRERKVEDQPMTAGRWPANLAHDGSPEVLAEFPVTKARGNKSDSAGKGATDDEIYAGGWGDLDCGARYNHDTPGDSGSAARFFYCAKASKSDRNEGLDDLPEQPSAASEFRPNHTEGAAAGEDGNPYGRWSPVRNAHPTVKPTALMQWLVRLVTPPGGLVLDPFTGSGSTGKAAMLEGFSFVGCEMDPDYATIARLRIDHAVNSR